MKQKLTAAISVLSLIFITTSCYVSKRLPIATGYSAKYLCSAYFVSHRNQDSIEKNDLNFSVIKFAHNKINDEEKTVTSKVLGLAKSKAIYIDGRGCVLVKGKSEEEIRKINSTTTSNSLTPDNKSVLWPNGDKVETIIPQNINKEKLDLALEKAFDDTKRIKKRNTRAVVVVYNNQIIAEKYSAGFDKNMPLLGWSMSKSITNALVGIMVKQGKLDINKPVDIKEWRNDSRKEITLNNLLQMSSGLEWNEGYGSLTDVVKMLYKSGDFYQYSMKKPLKVKPDSIWYYSSGTTNIVTGIIKNTFVNEKEYLEFPKKELFDKIGMHSAVFEVDASGNYAGSSYVYATPRDWARFGLLYLKKGNWNGEQILPETWVEYTKTPNKKSKGIYGAFFWLNKTKRLHDVPEDMYACYGFQEQRVFIIPSKNMVVVRMGLCDSGDFDFNEFLADIISTISSN
jgi:CubicO group peptidase (beta-lactamase class C family)